MPFGKLMVKPRTESAVCREPTVSVLVTAKITSPLQPIDPRAASGVVGSLHFADHLSYCGPAESANPITLAAGTGEAGARFDILRCAMAAQSRQP